MKLVLGLCAVPLLMQENFSGLQQNQGIYRVCCRDWVQREHRGGQKYSKCCLVQTISSLSLLLCAFDLGAGWLLGHEGRVSHESDWPNQEELSAPIAVAPF